MNETQFSSVMWEGLNVLRGELPLEIGLDVALASISLIYAENVKDEFPISDDALWSNIIQNGYGISKRFHRSVKKIEEAIPDLQDAFSFIDFNIVSDATLYKFVTTISRYSEPNKSEIGVVFKDILYRQMESQGIKGGELISPLVFKQLLPQLLDIRSGSVYDGTAGMGMLLLGAHEYAKQQYGDNVKLYGQDINNRAWAIGRLNLFVNGVRHFNYQQGNTLLNPSFKNDYGLEKFDYIMMNFPFSLKKWGSKEVENELYGRFIYGLPSNTNADMAFVSHAIASLSEKGKTALIVPHGVLFRGGAEGKIRQNILRADLIEAVIGLPANLFSNTAMPVAVIVINKNKAEERRGKILFIDASEEFKKGRGRNELRTEDIRKITETFHNGKEIESYSKFVVVDDIDNGVLSIPKYFEINQIVSKIGIVTVNSKAFKESNVPKKTLNDIALIYRGMNMPTKDNKEEKGETYKIVQLTDVQEGALRLNSLQRIRIKERKKAEQYMIQQGDILISSRGANVKIAIVPQLEEKVILSHNFIALRPTEAIDSNYIKAYLESPLGQYFLLSIQKGSTVKVLAVKEFENILIPIPSHTEQSRIGKEILKADQVYIEAVKKAEENRKTEYLKQYELMGISENFT
ncbi:N-6 DNA methylase [Priestia megaterium]|uniref:N-6 DNA methylase n=1 Tax=Priestia megaterium TaxID=1404 RepID=UPI000BFA0B8C|nr:N-6 DNA methylase [Priestia megaterium]PFQ80876.1 hypothetical protein COK11_19760 [Priestia megaterium]